MKQKMFIKSTVKQHTRKLKSGKIVNVREHEVGGHRGFHHVKTKSAIARVKNPHEYHKKRAQHHSNLAATHNTKALRHAEDYEDKNSEAARTKNQERKTKLQIDAKQSKKEWLKYQSAGKWHSLQAKAHANYLSSHHVKRAETSHKRIKSKIVNYARHSGVREASNATDSSHAIDWTSKKKSKKSISILDFQKSKVKQHQRKTKTGKIVNVREHQDSRIKKQAEERGLGRRKLQSTDLSKLTPQKKKAMVEKYAKLSIKDLRRRQSIIISNQKVVFKQRNDAELINLQTMERILAAAINKKEFGKSMESNMNNINLDKYPSLKKAIETTALKSLSFKKTGKEIKEAIESKLALMRLDLAVMIANQNIFESNKVTMETVKDSGLDEPVSEQDCKTVDDYKWKIESKQCDIVKLERYTRNLKPKLVYNLDGYELDELGL